MSYVLRNRPRTPCSLYGLVIEHWSTESEGLRFDSSWGLRIISLSHARDKTKIYHSLKLTFLGFTCPLKFTRQPNNYSKMACVADVLWTKFRFFFCCRNCPYSQISQHSKDSSVKDIGDEVKQSGQSQESIYSLTRFWKTDHIDIV